MKRLSLISMIALASMLVFSGCGQTNAPEESVEETTREVIETEAETVTEGEAEPAAESEDAGAPEIVQGSENTFVVFDKNNIKVTFYTAEDDSSGGPGLFMSLDNQSDSQIVASIENIVLNDKALVNGSGYIEAEPGEFQVTNFSHVNPVLYEALSEGLTKISMHVSVGEDYYYEMMDEDVALCPEDGFKFAVTTIPYMNCLAEEQILAETDSVRISLVNLGYALASYSSNKLQGTVMIENIGDTKIPIRISNVIVNGQTFDPISIGVDSLKKGMITAIPFSVSETDLTEAEITSISDVSLTILSSNEENTGYYIRDGGRSYPVVLSMKGEEAEVQRPDGTPIYSFGDISVYENGCEQMKYSNGYVWKFIVVNDSDDNVTLRFEDRKVLSGEADFKSEYTSSNDLAAHTMRVVKVNVRTEEGAEKPSLSGHFMLVLQGGSKMLDYDENETILK